MARKKKNLGRVAETAAKADLEATRSAGRHRASLPVQALSGVAKLGDQPELRLLSAALVAAGLLLGRRRLSRAGFRMLVAHEAATLAKDFVKNRVDRTRPRSARAHSDAAPEPGRKTAKEQTSFPSGHSAGAVAVARAYSREFPEHRAPALAAAGLIAVGQVPKRAHYPTDVLAGVIVGAATEAAVAAVWRNPDADG